MYSSVRFSRSVMSDSATPWTAACQASLSITNSQGLLKLMSIESVMLSSHHIICCPLLLLSPIPPSIRVFSMSQFFTSGSQNIGVSASASVLQWTPGTDLLYCSLLEKCKSKLQWDITSHRSEWPSSKSLQTINAGEGVEKREHSCTVAGKIYWYNHYGKQFRYSLKKKNGNISAIWPSIPTPGHTHQGNQNWKRRMYPNVHRSTVYNS